MTAVLTGNNASRDQSGYVLSAKADKTVPLNEFSGKRIASLFSSTEGTRMCLLADAFLSRGIFPL